ncbi:hypothetical protein SCRM01_027 [Synechococcus phage S-CRM01]|uniref:hypothetical protein n=1 Tax=Synechococcus phage S-CRM01 TaxID=1026955 RepID=UPI000209E345|nr:hypothetical protein SCRM01_027 [Synechococcus phage S-CRM01]AEC52974.1 hypothetical protein SCRM01_027 [Synechococcus phage S-CRM01]
MFKYIKTKANNNSVSQNRQMVWSGITTAVLASLIVSVGQPLWDIAVINPLILARLRQDFEYQKSKLANIEERLDTQDKLLIQIDQRLIQLKERLDKSNIK